MILRIVRSVSVMVMLLLVGQVQAANWITSADIRERYQAFDNRDFNSAIDDKKSEFDSRLYIKTKADFGNGLTLYLQPQAVLVKNKTVAATQNFSQADLLQAYLQYNVSDFSIRLGRQQLVYGDQRLLGHLGWKDVARTFDGVKGMYHYGDLKLDAFVVHPADIVAMTPNSLAPQGKSLVTWEDRRLMGLYGTYTLAPKSGLDAYMINWQHSQHATVGKGRNINTFGMRAFAQWQGLDATAEAVLQTGTWATGVSQKASAFAIKAGYTLDTWKTRLGVEYDFSPGDDKLNPATHKNFVFPFHTNHAQYGEMDFFSWGNMKDLHLSLKTSPLQGLSVMANMHMLSLDKATGDWLNVVGVGNVFAGAPGYKQTDAGTEVDVKIAYQLTAVKGLKLVALYGVFNPGSAVSERNAGKADSANFSYILANYKF